MSQTSFRESTKPLLRPHQVDAAERELKGINSMLNAPPHVAAQIQDRGEIVRRLRSTNRDLEAQSPKAYPTERLDDAVAREAELRAQIEEGMPTQEEMRRNPPGARDKHMAWERRNKRNLLEWKNIRLRLHASGHLDQIEYAGDVANFERFRPAGGAQELAMDNAQIPRQKTIFQVPPGAGQPVTMNDEQLEVLAELEPNLRQKVGLLTNEQRRGVVALIDRYLELETPKEIDSLTKKVKAETRAKGDRRKNISEEERERRREQARKNFGLDAPKEA